jgi:hypothetical protein
MKSHHYRRILAVIVSVPLFLGAGASAHNLTVSLADNQASNQAAANDGTYRSGHVRSLLQSSLHEHAALTVPALKAQLLQEPDLAALMAAVEHNNTDVITAVSAAYPGTGDQFATLWRQHITYYQDYLGAAARGDEAGKAAAKQNLANFAAATSNLLATASPQLDQATLQQQLAMHGDQVTAIIDNLVAGNYDAVYSLAHEAYMHMGTLADTLASGRIR